MLVVMMESSSIGCNTEYMLIASSKFSSLLSVLIPKMLQFLFPCMYTSGPGRASNGPTICYFSFLIYVI